MLVSLVAEVSLPDNPQSTFTAFNQSKVHCYILSRQIRVPRQQDSSAQWLHRPCRQQKHSRGRNRHHRVLCHGSNPVWCRVLLPLILAGQNLSSMVEIIPVGCRRGNQSGNGRVGICKHGKSLELCLIRLTFNQQIVVATGTVNITGASPAQIQQYTSVYSRPSVGEYDPSGLSSQPS